MRGDSGAVAIVVALLAVVMFGFGALVIDVGALYAERRQLQNGADAAAFAVAQYCAGGDCGAFQDDAEVFADSNAEDEAADVTEVCGVGAPELPPCVEPLESFVGSGYVKVTTRTEELDGTFLVPPFLARVLVPGYEGAEVGADAAVAWGAAGGVDAELAITFSQCEYEKLTQDADGNTVYATAPFDPALERIVYFHDTSAASSCPAGPSGADLPGGFGWLSEDDCTATFAAGWVEDDPGASASQDCKAALDALVGQTVLIPVFDETNRLTGSNGQYHIWSFVGFVLTGWRFPGTSHPSDYLPGVPCNGSQTCLSGFFVETVAGSSGPISSGSDQGVRVVQLIQ